MPRALFNDPTLRERDRKEIEAQLLTYFPGAAPGLGVAYSQLVLGTYWLITNRRAGRADTLTNLNAVPPAPLHDDVDELEDPYVDEPDFEPRRAYFFVSRSVSRETSEINEETNSSDPIQSVSAPTPRLPSRISFRSSSRHRSFQ